RRRCWCAASTSRMARTSAAWRRWPRFSAASATAWSSSMESRGGCSSMPARSRSGLRHGRPADMPVLWLKSPLGCIIWGGGQDGDGIKLAVMAAPCALRPPPLKIGTTTARTLQRLLDGPKRVTALAGVTYGGSGYTTLKSQCEALRRMGLVELRGWEWSITAAGRDWIASHGPRG